MTEIIERPVVPAAPNVGPSPARRKLCIVTVAACAPYLTLKVLWILGIGLGVNGSTFLDDTRPANIATAFMDLCAAGLAVLFVHPVGRRIPALLVGLPTWVATGLLTPLCGGLVLGLPAQLLSGGDAFRDDGGLNAWVFVVVYSGFLVQAGLLIPAFALYARDRWPALFAARQAAIGTAGPHRTRRILEGGFVVGATVFAAQHMYDAIAGGGLYLDPTTTQRVAQLTFALLAMVGVAAYTQFWRGRPQSRKLLAAAWIGSGVVFAESLSLVTDLVVAGPDDDPIYGPGAALLCVLSLLCALGGAIAGMLRLEATTSRLP
ncbi:hypothetical protein [Flexivirga sp. B27]